MSSQEFIIPSDPAELWDADASGLGLVVCEDFSEEFANSENRLVHHAEGVLSRVYIVCTCMDQWEAV